MTDPRVIIQMAYMAARSGRFKEMMALCGKLIEFNTSSDTLLDVGVLFLNFGFLSEAQKCFEKGRVIDQSNLRFLVNLANIARDAGDHAESRRIYSILVECLPNNQVVRRNALISMEYDPEISDSDSLSHAKNWGEWAIVQAGGWVSRPTLRSLTGRILRIGYVSADFCQHTVGLFIKSVINAHDDRRVSVFVYSAGFVNDWVTEEIRSVCQFKDVSMLNDSALAELIRRDDIDLLIDLSGHTAGSRLTVFAHRPAPVLVSWLGYFATTGLSYVDAVLLDDWHTPANIEENFVEPVLRLPQSRFCYRPVSFAPEVSPPPFCEKGYITFGSFNNTAKYNQEVFVAWARILNDVPNSRLVLKWRTFIDLQYKNHVWRKFNELGISRDRIDLREASFHADVLKQYADIDIALDPFPFTGGMTSCEAMWMGVPVITWPQSKVVSRQTFAILSVIGFPELASKDLDDYVHIATTLAKEHSRLIAFRKVVRTRMEESPLMDVNTFTFDLEHILINLYKHIELRE